MIDDLPCLAQARGSNDCLPTAVRAVLLRHGRYLSPEKASVLCRTTDAGSAWYDAMQGLGDEFDVHDLSGNWERITDSLLNDEEPVIVRIGLVIRDPLYGPSVEGHAVVIRAIQKEEIVYMDPLTGADCSVSTESFLKMWDLGECLACIVLP